MYLYLITLHRKETPAAAPIGPCGQPEVSLMFDSSRMITMSSPGPLLDHPILHQTPDASLHAQFQLARGSETPSIYAARWLFLEEAIPVETIASALTTYYRKFFGSSAYIHMESIRTATGADYREILYLSECCVRCECIPVPKTYTPEQMESEFLANWLVEPKESKKLFYREQGKYRPEDERELNTDFKGIRKGLVFGTSFVRFVDYLKAWSSAERVKGEWHATMANPAGEGAILQGATESSDQGMDLVTAFIGRERSTTTATATPLKNGKRVVLVPALDRVVFPCSITSFLGTAFCSEVSTQELTIPSSALEPDCSFLPYSQLETVWTEARDVMRPLATTAAVPTATAPLSAKPSHPHAQHLKELWTIFTNEYVSHKYAPGWTGGVPHRLFQAAWKLFALRPKASKLHTVERFADTLVGAKRLPAGWEKDITSELLSEWFNEHKDASIAPNTLRQKACFLTHIMNSHFYYIVRGLYGKSIPSGPDDPGDDSSYEQYMELNTYDYTPVVEVLLGEQLSEASKVVWIKSYIREMVTASTTGSVVGSLKLYDSFKGWFCGKHISNDERSPSKYIQSQIPIAEFTRLIKAQGFEMTRRARGMVYLNMEMKGDVESPLDAAEKAAEVAAAVAEEVAQRAEESVAGDIVNQVNALEESVIALAGKKDRIYLKHGTTPEETLLAYQKLRDEVYMVQTNAILAAGTEGKDAVPVTAGTLLTGLDWMDAALAPI